MKVYFLELLDKESTKEGVLTVQTCCGTGKFIKSGEYSGQVMKCDYFSQKEKIEENLLSELCKKGNIKIRQFKYRISFENRDKFLTNAIKFGLYYRNKKRKLVPIKFVKNWEKDSGEKEITVSLNQYEMNLNKDLLTIRDKLNQSIEMKQKCLTKPVPVVYLSVERGNIFCELAFQYGNVRIKPTAIDENIKDGEKIYVRDLISEEEECLVLCKEGCWVERRTNKFLYVGNDISEEVDRLIREQFILYVDKEQVSSNQKVSIDISYHMDWFEVQLSGEKGQGHIADFVRQLRENRKPYILIDNQIQFLPKEFLNHVSEIEIREDRVGFRKNQIGNLLEMQKSCKQISLRNPEQLISYESIDIKNNLLERTLFSYQKEGVRWLLSLYLNEFGGCLADDMGMGKTIQVIAFLSDERVRKIKLPSLILMPAILIDNWMKEFQKFNSFLRVSQFYGAKRELNMNSDIILSTFDTAYMSQNELSGKSFNLLIMDEFQKVKNHNSKKYKTISCIKAKCKLALTGTPVENNIMELWSMMDLVNPGVMESAKEFKKKYFDTSNSDKLKEKVRPFLLRREKTLLGEVLPKKTEHIIYCEFGEKQKELYDSAITFIREEKNRKPDRYEIKKTSLELEGLTLLREICIHPYLISSEKNVNNCKESGKLIKIMETLRKEYEAGNKIVLFSQFVRMLNIIKLQLEKNNMYYSIITGETKKRQDIINDFEKKEKGILLMSLKSSGFGINLVSANVGIMCDPWWNPAVEHQAEDRLYRIGQKRDVKIYRFVMRDSIEEKMEELKDKKRDVSNGILYNMDEIKNLMDYVLNTSKEK